MNIANFTINHKVTLKEFSKILKKILHSKVHKFPVDGKFLKKNGMKEGATLGEVLKLIEKEWVKNNFTISKNRIVELIKLNLN